MLGDRLVVGYTEGWLGDNACAAGDLAPCWRPASESLTAAACRGAVDAPDTMTHQELAGRALGDIRRSSHARPPSVMQWDPSTPPPSSYELTVVLRGLASGRSVDGAPNKRSAASASRRSPKSRWSRRPRHGCGRRWRRQSMLELGMVAYTGAVAGTCCGAASRFDVSCLSQFRGLRSLDTIRPFC